MTIYLDWGHKRVLEPELQDFHPASNGRHLVKAEMAVLNIYATAPCWRTNCSLASDILFLQPKKFRKMSICPSVVRHVYESVDAFADRLEKTMQNSTYQTPLMARSLGKENGGAI